MTENLPEGQRELQERVNLCSTSDSKSRETGTASHGEPEGQAQQPQLSLPSTAASPAT